VAKKKFEDLMPGDVLVGEYGTYTILSALKRSTAHLPKYEVINTYDKYIEGLQGEPMYQSLFLWVLVDMCQDYILIRSE